MRVGVSRQAFKCGIKEHHQAHAALPQALGRYNAAGCDSGDVLGCSGPQRCVLPWERDGKMPFEAAGFS